MVGVVGYVDYWGDVDDVFFVCFYYVVDDSFGGVEYVGEVGVEDGLLVFVFYV